MDQPDRIKELFLAALELSAAERAAFLARACAGDDALLAELLELLAAHDDAGSFLAEPGGAVRAAVGAAAEVAETAGETIGAYKLVERIGEGTFGTVWVAEQREPVRRAVALKILKAGMDSAQVVARFEQERQALALMAHPHIAQVFDAGTTPRGRPFFVMELVKGVPLTDYVRQHGLSLQARLELFVQVCRAVQHAHGKGVIHRDLKPGNVLVATADGRPLAKVIDFGVAKATGARLTEKTLLTEHRGMVGTLAYMSPEQAEGLLDVDTRSDVYSLGAMLYELLTGGTPFDVGELREQGLREVLRLLREVDPQRPSVRVSSKGVAAWAGGPGQAVVRGDAKALFGALRGDLDWVVLKALEKERGRRYASADGLAEDVERYLAGDAVLAVPPSVGYRVRKFIMKHRVQATYSVLLVVLTSVLGTLAISKSLEIAELAVSASLASNAAATEKTRADEADAAARKLAEDKAALSTGRAVAEQDAAVRRRQADAAERDRSIMAKDNTKMAEQIDVLAESVRRTQEEKATMALELRSLKAGPKARQLVEQQELLWPAIPEIAPQLEQWLQDCDTLLSEVPEIRNEIERSGHVDAPAIAGSVQSNGQDHREWTRYRDQAAKVASMRRAGVVRRDGRPVMVGKVMNATWPGSLESLISFAWSRVSPFAEGPQKRVFYGDELAGLTAARAALSLADNRSDRHEALLVLAWAEHENGDDEAATKRMAEARSAAPSDLRLAYALQEAHLTDSMSSAFARLLVEEAELSRLTGILDKRLDTSAEGGGAGANIPLMRHALDEALRGCEQLASRFRPDVESRLRWAREVRQASLAHPRARVTWSEARESIRKADGTAASRAYAGMSIALSDEDVIGLVPIGVNPSTKLWEFYDLRSAWDGSCSLSSIEIPRHNYDGSIEVGAGTGVVLVLVPGGLVAMGSQCTAPGAPFFVAPPSRSYRVVEVFDRKLYGAGRAIDDWIREIAYTPIDYAGSEVLHYVSLSAFFLARHEMTIGQWGRIAGAQGLDGMRGHFIRFVGSEAGPTQPANFMSWVEAERWLRRSGMSLPTEAQWEYGARAGATSDGWLGRFVVVGDENIEYQGFPGYRHQSSMNNFDFNRFGLYEVRGSVREWCRDKAGRYGSERPEDGLRVDDLYLDTSRVVRGGSNVSVPAESRSANRDWRHLDHRSPFIGIRAARSTKK
jgi:serine/threonine protein kinase/formylglycine-generating enzyme required for sulfatase activity